MASRAALARLATRIEALAEKLTPRPEVAVVFQQQGETEDQSYARHYADRPEDRNAKLTVFYRDV